MKPGGGKRKGGSFERDVCKILTLELTGKDNPIVFWRTSGSGSQATTCLKKGHSTKMGGDIMALSEDVKWATDIFYIECKSYKFLNVMDLFLKKGKLYDFWIKCCENSRELDKAPMLVFKYNRSDIFVLLKTSDCIEKINISIPEVNCIDFVYSKSLDGIILLNFTNFLKILDRKGKNVS